MADYKVVFRSDTTTDREHRLLWSPGSPALLTAVQLSRNTQTSTAFLQVKLRNISDNTIRSVGCSARISYSDGAHDDIEFEDLDVDLEQSREKPLKPQQLPKGNVEAADVTLTSITCDGEKWSASSDPISVPRPMPLAISERAMSERRRILQSNHVIERAIGNAVIDNGPWWVCACGQLNVGRDECCECGANKDLLLGYESEEGLIASADALATSLYQKAIELSQNRQDEEAQAEAITLFERIGGWRDADERALDCQAAIEEIKAKKRIKAKKITSIIGGSAAVLTAVALIVFFIAPFVKYRLAISHADSGQQEKAVVAFRELGDYMDSKDRLRESEYAYAVAHRDAKDELTFLCLTDLKEQGYKDAKELYSSLYSWHFESILSTDTASFEPGRQVFTWKEKSTYGSKEKCFLLLRATSGPLHHKMSLNVSVEFLTKGSQVWTKRDDETVKVASNGEISNVFLGNGASDAIKVKVSDLKSGAVLFEGEAHKE